MESVSISWRHHVNIDVLSGSPVVHVADNVIRDVFIILFADPLYSKLWECSYSPLTLNVLNFAEGT